MKKIILFTCSLILFSTLSAQNKISITLKDSTIINGFGRVKIDERILFRKSKDAEKEFYDHKTVEKLTIYNDDSEQTYKYKVVEGSLEVGTIKLLEIIKIGKVNLYQDYASGMSYGPNMAGGGYGFTSHSKTTYYISKSETDTVTNLRIGNTYSKRFKKIAKRYFKTCPGLLEKINNKYFKRYGIESVIEYYNLNCEN